MQNRGGCFLCRTTLPLYVNFVKVSIECETQIEDLKHFGDGYVFDYENRDEKSMKLMQLIDQIDELTSEEISSEYLKIKQELLNLNMKNPIDKISYHYYSSYKNVIN